MGSYLPTCIPHELVGKKHGSATNGPFTTHQHFRIMNIAEPRSVCPLERLRSIIIKGIRYNLWNCDTE